MRRIAVITSDVDRDWASRQLLEAIGSIAEGEAVDPMSFEILMYGQPAIFVSGRPAGAYDAYIVRALNGRGEIDYQYEVLELLQHKGMLVINSTEGLSAAESKVQTTFLLQQAGLPVPRTLATQDRDEAVSAVSAFGAAVVKPLYGSHGIGIEKITPEMSAEFMPAFLDEHGAIYVQEFVPNEGRDIRAFVVGDDIPAAIYRAAPEGQWKTNVFLGGGCESCRLSPEMRELCLKAARVVGLDYTGVDLTEGPSGPVVLELNGAPSWHGLAGATGRNVAMDVASHVLEMLDIGQPARRPEGFHPR